jgi:hypothetical protein
MDLRIQGFNDTMIQKFKGSRIQEFKEFQSLRVQDQLPGMYYHPLCPPIVGHLPLQAGGDTEGVMKIFLVVTCLPETWTGGKPATRT